MCFLMEFAANVGIVGDVDVAISTRAFATTYLVGLHLPGSIRSHVAAHLSSRNGISRPSCCTYHAPSAAQDRLNTPTVHGSYNRRQIRTRRRRVAQKLVETAMELSRSYKTRSKLESMRQIELQRLEVRQKGPSIGLTQTGNP